MVETGKQFEIYDISKDTSRLVCRIEVAAFMYTTCALNEDGSEAAFVIYNGDGLQVVKVDKSGGSAMDQSTVVKVPESLGLIIQLTYDNEGKLCVLSGGGNVSLFNPSTKEFILLESQQEGQVLNQVAISPNADYIAILQQGDKVDQRFAYTMTVKQNFEKAYLEDFFGYKAEGKGHKQ